jgi:hypothetical protein
MGDDEERGGDPDEERIERSILRAVRARILGSIATLVVGTVAWLLYLGVWAVRFPWYTNVAVLLAIPVLGVSGIAAMWVSFGVSVCHRFGRSADFLGG